MSPFRSRRRNRKQPAPSEVRAWDKVSKLEVELERVTDELSVAYSATTCATREIHALQAELERVKQQRDALRDLADSFTVVGARSPEQFARWRAAIAVVGSAVQQ